MPPRLASLPAVVLSAVALVACGGDDETTTSTAPATGPTGATGAAGSTDPEAKAVARTAQTAIEAYFVDKQSYAGADTEVLRKIEPTLPDDLEVEGDKSTYSITAPSPSGNSFTVERSEDGKVTYSCTEPGVGSCAEDGEW